MKRLLLTLLVLTMLPISVTFAQTEGNMAGLLYGSVWTEDNFDNTHGGLKLGMQTAIDQEKGVWLRVVYSQYNFDPEPIQTLGISGIFQWYAGKKVNFWFVTGTEAYMDGVNDGADLFTGLGFSRSIWTVNNSDWAIAPKVSMFGEVTFTDAGGQSTGNFVQFNLGLSFNRGKQ